MNRHFHNHHLSPSSGRRNSHLVESPPEVEAGCPRLDRLQDGQGHAGAFRAASLCAVPGPVRIILAYPARAVATRALRPLTQRLASDPAGHPWWWLFDPTRSAFNWFLQLLGFEEIPWLSDPYWARFSVILVNVWYGAPFF